MDEEEDYFATQVIEYMTGEWNKISTKIERIVRTLLKKRYNGTLTWGQFRFIEQAFGMPDQEVTDFKDETDLANAIEMYGEETRLKFWKDQND